MAFSSYRTRFQGTLGNVPTNELIELDYNKNTLEERLDYLQQKYKKIKRFHEVYIFTKEETIDGGCIADHNEQELAMYYKYNPSTKDELSADINIFKYLERDASYLLNSRDVPRDSQQKYLMLTAEEFDKHLKMEKEKRGIIEFGELFVVKESGTKNFYKDNSIVIYKADFRDPDVGQVLSEYESLRVHLKEQMENIKKGKNSYLDLNSIKRMLGCINTDMTDAKKMLKGIRNPAKRLGDESGCFYTEMLDYSNEHHVKQLLKFVPITKEIRPDSEMSHIGYDLAVAIDNLKKSKRLDELDLEIVECYNSGYVLEDIATEVDRGVSTIHQRLKKIFKRVAEYYSR